MTKVKRHYRHNEKLEKLRKQVCATITLAAKNEPHCEASEVLLRFTLTRARSDTASLTFRSVGKIVVEAIVAQSKLSLTGNYH